MFDWEPDQKYDVVFSADWLSHVPPPKFDDFWALVWRCVEPGGGVGFVDEDDRVKYRDHLVVVDGVPAARRTLSDGRHFDIVKVFCNRSELAKRLRSLGWQASIAGSEVRTS